MSRVYRFITVASLPFWLAACSSDQLAGPVDGLSMSMGGSATESVELNGVWNITRVVQITAPEWVAVLIFGVVPEGPITHILCETTGTMELRQDGDTFDGTAQGTTSACETRGGQSFSSGEGAEIEILNGAINGRSVTFDWLEDRTVLCPYKLAIAADADRMSGTGRCIVPGHPKSPVPMDPPPGGTSKTLRFEATRG
jgi:hypothetical protein